MNNNNHKSDLVHEIDLADFTDKALDGQPMTRSTNSDEYTLEEIVLALKAKTASPPPADMQERIKSRTLAAYNQAYTKKKEAKSGLFKFFSGKQKEGYRSQSQRQRTMAIQFAIAAGVITTILLFTLPPSEPGSTTGTATGSLGLWLPLGVLILAGVLIGWLWFNKKD